MSDGQGPRSGPGWWLASDGKWYPPDQAPAGPAGGDLGHAAAAGRRPDGDVRAAPRSRSSSAGRIVGCSSLRRSSRRLLLGDEDESSSSDGTDRRRRRRAGDGARRSTPADRARRLRRSSRATACRSRPRRAGRRSRPEDVAMSPEELARGVPRRPRRGCSTRRRRSSSRAPCSSPSTSASDFASQRQHRSRSRARLRSMTSRSQVELQLERHRRRGRDASSKSTIPVGEAVRVEYTLDVASPTAAPIPAEGVQYYVAIDGRTYVITVSSGRRHRRRSPTRWSRRSASADQRSRGGPSTAPPTCRC